MENFQEFALQWVVPAGFSIAAKFEQWLRGFIAPLGLSRLARRRRFFRVLGRDTHKYQQTQEQAQ
jgi:hypothetical protein